MSKALSVDLRERVVAAVAAGASRRAAAARFGVGISSAIRWCAMSHETGSVAPGPLGGDRRSARVEAHAALIKELVERQPDATLLELQIELARAGLCCSQGAIWRFFKRHQITHKKRRPTRPSRTVPTS
jgi:transposase